MCRYRGNISLRKEDFSRVLEHEPQLWNRLEQLPSSAVHEVLLRGKEKTTHKHLLRVFLFKAVEWRMEPQVAPVVESKNLNCKLGKTNSSSRSGPFYSWYIQTG